MLRQADDVKVDTNRKCPIYSLKQIYMDHKSLLRGMIQTKHPLRPFPHYDAVSKYNEFKQIIVFCPSEP